MPSVRDFLIGYAIGLIFYACYFPLLMACMRVANRVVPGWVLALARWLVVPALMLVVTRGLLGWDLDRIFVSQVSYYAATLFRLLRVIRGEKPSDTQMLIGLFVAAQGPEFRKWLEEKGYRFGQEDDDSS